MTRARPAADLGQGEGCAGQTGLLGKGPDVRSVQTQGSEGSKKQLHRDFDKILVSLHALSALILAIV